MYRAGSRVKVTGAMRTAAFGSTTAAASAAYFQPSGRSLLALKGATGQLRVDVTLASGGSRRRGHVSALGAVLGAAAPPRGRRLSAACTKLPVQVGDQMCPVRLSCPDLQRHCMLQLIADPAQKPLQGLLLGKHAELDCA